MPLLTWLLEQPGRLQDHSAVASTAGVMTAGAAFVVIRARFTAVNASVPLYALLHVNDTDAVAARALHPFDGLTHDITPALALMSTSRPSQTCPTTMGESQYTPPSRPTVKNWSARSWVVGRGPVIRD
jgi:hypothetical protein